MGQDLHSLSADLYKNDSAATTPKQLYGSDVLGGIWEVGFDLFQDRKKFNADFMIANILNTEASTLPPLRGTFDVVYICHAMHLFDYSKQLAAAKSPISLTTPCLGAMIIGSQLGAKKAFDMHYASFD